MRSVTQAIYRNLNESKFTKVIKSFVCNKRMRLTHKAPSGSRSTLYNIQSLEDSLSRGALDYSRWYYLYCRIVEASVRGDAGMAMATSLLFFFCRKVVAYSTFG